MSNVFNPREVVLGGIEGVHIWKMPVFSDLRGRLFKAYVAEPTGSFPIPFSTYEHFFTESKEDVFRGMHFQGAPHAVSKVISLVQGATIDFLFDMRKDSKTYGVLQIQKMDEENLLSLYIPEGVAHDTPEQLGMWVATRNDSVK